jgi:hypothetical protein
MSALGSFLLHASAAMIIGPVGVFAVILTAAVLFQNSLSINSALNAGGVLNPLMWGPGLILGILVNRFALMGAACWVWAPGIVWIAYGILTALLAYHVRFAGICSPFDNITISFFSFDSNYCGGGENVMRFTLPTFSSIAYSLRAWITLRLVRRTALPSDPAMELMKNLDLH